MNLSGIVVLIGREQLAEGALALSALPGVQVHQVDAGEHRLVLTQVTATTEEQEEGLRRIQALPFVLHAALVHHYFDTTSEDGDGEEPAPIPLGRKPR